MRSSRRRDTSTNSSKASVSYSSMQSTALIFSFSMRSGCVKLSYNVYRLVLDISFYPPPSLPPSLSLSLSLYLSLPLSSSLSLSPSLPPSPLQICKRYRDDLLHIIARLRKQEVKLQFADVIFTTAHKSKGLEFDNVKLADDFLPNFDLPQSLHSEYIILYDNTYLNFLDITWQPKFYV